MGARLLKMSAIAALLAATPVHAQTIQGVVLDQELGSGVPNALVRLVDGGAEDLVVVSADSLGRFRLRAPRPGEYTLWAEGLGYETTRSPLLAVPNADAVYGVDLELTKRPLGLPGFEVTADRFATVDRRLRQLVGRNVASLRIAPIRRPRIEDHLARSHDVEDLVRWSAIPSIEIRQTPDGPCFLIRGGTRVRVPDSCAGVHLNGVLLGRRAVLALPLDLVETVVIVMPEESIAYPKGAILLYTAGWIG